MAMARLAVKLSALVFMLLSLLPLLASSTAAQGAATSPEQELAERYVPVAYLREQPQRCAVPPQGGEPYLPLPVEMVIGNDQVQIRDGADGDRVIATGPDAAELATYGPETYMDFPGDPRRPGCTFETDERQRVEELGLQPTTYAHIVFDATEQRLALQYWFFWYFNQFNDLHEGDWEGMQVTFESETPAAALRSGEEPDEIILFQHAGGERAAWTDSKVQKDGTRPVVYSAAGSHATFYDSAVYVENGQQGSGLGCDNTSEPLEEVPLRPVLLPDRVTRTGPFEWLSYEGRWGEREKGYNNGPTGPPTKTVWREPFAWMAEQRTTSPRLPGGSIVGPQVTSAFCGAVGVASELINLDAKSRPAAIATVLGLLLALALFVGVTRWGPVDLTRLRARRSFGQILRAARQLYGRHWRVLVPVALTAIPIVGGINLLADQLHGSGGLDEAAGRSGLNLATADLIESVALPAAQALVAAVVIVFVRSLVTAAAPVGFRAAWGGVRQRFWRVVGAQLMATLGIFLLAVTVVGLPFALYKLVAWRFVQQEVLFTDKKIREAFHGSSDLVRGRWWRTVRLALFLTLFSIAAGPIVSFALIFTSLPLIWVNLLGALVFSLMIPYVALGDTLLYFDLGERAREEGIKPARSWRRG
jgi:hypothetical protein